MNNHRLVSASSYGVGLIACNICVDMQLRVPVDLELIALTTSTPVQSHQSFFISHILIWDVEW